MSRPLAAAVVAAAAVTAGLAAPSAALACSGGTSAVAVYQECFQGGGGTATGGPSTGANSNSTSPHFSGPTTKALTKAGKDQGALSALVRSYGLRRQLQTTSSGRETAPSAVGSAFDLGSGPTALLIALAGTAFLLLGGSGMRVWRNRHRV
jgi:hypothetical protein